MNYPKLLAEVIRTIRRDPNGYKILEDLATNGSFNAEEQAAIRAVIIQTESK